jgi:hypothetical protein
VLNAAQLPAPRRGQKAEPVRRRVAKAGASA